MGQKDINGIRPKNMEGAATIIYLIALNMARRVVGEEACLHRRRALIICQI